MFGPVKFMYRGLFLCAYLFLSVPGCTSEPEASESERSAVPVVGTVPEFELMAENGESFGSDDLHGKVWIATVIMTRSQTTTPQQTAMMAELERQLAEDPARHGVRLVTLTAEPERDTPEALQAYRQAAGAVSPYWKFVTGERGTVIEIVEHLGLTVREDARTSERPITVSPQFVLVDRTHGVRGVYDVFTASDLAILVRDLRFVLPEAPDIDDGTERTHLAVPPQNLDLPWFESRREDQLAKAADFGIFHDFGFEDRRPESGITFRNKIVDNAGKAWMPNHYDHGNGVATADVDGDGRLDLYFTTQVGSNELWRNVGDGRFENMTANVGLEDRVSVTASFADVDNDGDPDLYVTTVKDGNVLFLNDGSGGFVDASEGSGVDYVGHSSGSVFFDYDRDGLLDLFLVNVGIYTSDRRIPVTNGTSPEQSDGRNTFYEGLEDAFVAHLNPDRAERSLLFKNVGEARFRDVTEEFGLMDESWSGDAVPFDANGDGWIDLYVLNMQGADQYYENAGGERFMRKSQELFPRTSWGAMGAKAFDYDNDGLMDLYITDMHSDMSENVGPEREEHKSHMQWPDSLVATEGESIFGNAFFRQAAPGNFEEISDRIGAENYWPWGLSAGDLNADGYDDVFVASSMNFPFRYGLNSVLLNDRGRRFLDSEYVVGVEPRRDAQMLTPWFTLDCDEPDSEHEYCERRRGEVVVWGSVGSRSSAVFDLDDDGDLDIVTNDFNSEPMVLVSNLSERKEDLRFLKVKLVGTESNRDGLGSVVTVSAGGRTYVKLLDGATGYLSHGVHPLYFGLGESAQVDRIEVRWPSGKTQVVNGPIESNQQVVVTEE